MKPVLEPGGSGAARMHGGQWMRGRKFNADELQAMLLWFMREAPAHGYELAKRFGELSHGYYTPSPGALYPALSQLEARGLARFELAGKRKIHRITAAGFEHLQADAERIELLFATLRHAAKKMLWLSHVNESEAAASDATGWLPEFVRARQALRRALASRGEPGHAEQRRLAAILQRAARDIRQGSPAGDPAAGDPAAGDPTGHPVHDSADQASKDSSDQYRNCHDD
ncbi:MAG: PadR family transcriptional regulator [Burkholderiaceae bacterium]